MGLLKISAMGVGGVAAAYISWKLLTLFLAISFLVLKIALIGAVIIGAIWLYRRIMSEPVRSDTTA